MPDEQTRRHRSRPVHAFHAAWAVAALAAIAVIGAGVVVAAQPDYPPSGLLAAPEGPPPHDMALASYSGCSALLAGLRSHTAAAVTADGLPGTLGNVIYDRRVALPASSNAEAPTHSVTNDQESGADEPDLVKSDGRRIVSVSAGTLRVVDTATRAVTGSLDLGVYAGADSAQLLVDGDRALVLLGGGASGSGTGDVVTPVPGSTPAAATYLLVDLGGRPRVLSTLRPKGSYVDARLVGGRVRLVVSTTPTIRFPAPGGMVEANRAEVRRAPLDAWRPSYEVTGDGVTTSHDVPCSQVQHPVRYTGSSMLTVYTIDPGAGFADLKPISLAADATTVYATTSSLYVAGHTSPYTRGTKTQLYRFDIRGTGRPAYRGSATLPGSLLGSYSLSDYDASLRVVTTDGDLRTPSTTVYVLNADTLRQTGHVGGLGEGQRLYAVRFAGPLAYVVTFRSVDPLYVLDLRDPTRPRKAGELHITGYSSYLHPVASGRLLGVGQDVRDNVVAGLQVSLFDVASPSRPTRLGRVVLPHTPGEQAFDPHAFLYWPATGTAVVPIRSWDSGQSERVLVLHVTATSLRTVGTVGQSSAIERSLVVGDQLWTMSPDGFAVSDLQTLRRTSWIAFS